MKRAPSKGDAASTRDIEEVDAWPIIGFPLPPLDECPVIPMGAYEGRVVFAMPDSQIRDERAADIVKLLRTDIFRCAAGQSFLANWVGPDGKLMREMCAIWFNRQCSEAGYWDRSRPQRGPGVWPGADGEIILHRGNELHVYRPGQAVEVLSITEALRKRKDAIYRLASTAPAPADAATAADGQRFRRLLDLWNWEPIGAEGLTGADVLAGWTMAALLGAASSFRPPAIVYAQAGAGKTTLLGFVHAAVSAICGDLTDNSTPAGFANDMAGMARPVIIDEAEATPGTFGPSPMDQKIELIRRMATGSGATKKLGAIGGRSVTQTAIGAVLMAAVNPVRLGPADKSRIVEIRLEPLSPREGRSLATDSDLNDAIDWARRLAPAFLGRALEGVHRFRSDFELLKAAFTHSGVSPRSADLVAAIAAGRRLLMFDEPLDAASADEEATLWAGLLKARDEASAVVNTGEECFHHLLAAQSGLQSSGRPVTFGEMIVKTVEGDASEDSARALLNAGMLVERAADGGWWLLLCHNHPQMKRLFDKTPWPDWARTLGFLRELGPDHATQSGPAKRFGLIRQRTTNVPLEPVIGDKRAGT